MSRLSLWLSVALLGAVMGCDDAVPEPKTANDVPPPAPMATADNDGEGKTKSDNSSGVGIDDRIRKMCNLPEARFDFDSASVSGSAKGLLDAIVTCFTTGPGKGHNLNIVGHADPRGETEYNFALGQQRAGSVTSYLTKNGLADGRIETSSRGELEATGSEESGWSRDRRVEILLAD
jgi:peptidoglycan-associated lipoprotein